MCILICFVKYFHTMISCRSVGLRSERVRVGKADPNFLRVYFWKILLHNTHKLNCYQHTMFTMCILFSTLTTKAWGICKGASKQSPGLKTYTPRPSKIPGSAARWGAYGELQIYRTLYHWLTSSGYLRLHSAYLDWFVPPEVSVV